jgi:AcrR family transcriptional regulator
VPTNRKRNPWRGKPLPRGRHGLTAETVLGSQRERLIKAMLDLVARHGYAATTVPEVVAAARVSRNAFYELFADKEACFLAVSELIAVDLFGAVSVAAVGPSWQDRVRNAFRVYLRWWQDRPEFSKAYFVEMPTVGRRAVEQRERAYEAFEKLFAQAAKLARGKLAQPAPHARFIPRFLVIAVTETIAAQVRADRGHRLVELEDALVYSAAKLLGS